MDIQTVKDIARNVLEVVDRPNIIQTVRLGPMQASRIKYKTKIVENQS